MVDVLVLERRHPGRRVSLAAFILVVLVDALLKLPERLLAACFVMWAVVSMAALAAVLVRQRRGKRSLAATARRVELAFPELESHLINVVQFAGRDGVEADPFRQAAITQSAAAVADFPFEQAAAKEDRWHRFSLCMQTPRDLLESVLVLALVLGLVLLLYVAVSHLGLLDPPDLASVLVRPLGGLGQDHQGRARRRRRADRLQPANLRRDR